MIENIKDIIEQLTTKEKEFVTNNTIKIILFTFDLSLVYFHFIHHPVLTFNTIWCELMLE